MQAAYRSSCKSNVDPTQKVVRTTSKTIQGNFNFHATATSQLFCNLQMCPHFRTLICHDLVYCFDYGK